jgi:hypothetical protein
MSLHPRNPVFSTVILFRDGQPSYGSIVPADGEALDITAIFAYIVVILQRKMTTW